MRASLYGKLGTQLRTLDAFYACQGTHLWRSRGRVCGAAVIAHTHARTCTRIHIRARSQAQAGARIPAGVVADTSTAGTRT